MYSCCLVLHSCCTCVVSCCTRVVLLLSRVVLCCTRVALCYVVLRRVVTRVVFQTRSEERGQNLAETNRGSYYNQEEWVEEFLDDKGAFYNDGSESDDSNNDDEIYNKNMEAVVRRCSFKIDLLKNFANFKGKRLCWSYFLIKLQARRLAGPAELLKTLWHRCFPVKFTNFLRTPFLQNTSGSCF